MYAKAIWRMFMEDLNELKEKIEDKYYSEIFSIVENYLNENKEEFCPEDSFYICCWHWFILVIKQYYHDN